MVCGSRVSTILLMNSQTQSWLISTNMTTDWSLPSSRGNSTTNFFVQLNCAASLLRIFRRQQKTSHSRNNAAAPSSRNPSTLSSTKRTSSKTMSKLNRLIELTLLRRRSRLTQRRKSVLLAKRSRRKSVSRKTSRFLQLLIAKKSIVVAYSKNMRENS